MLIRQAGWDDLTGLLALYTHLHGNGMPPLDDAIRGLWRQILDDPNHYVLLAVEDGIAVSSCVLIVVRNLTRSQRPYALIENVVTHEAYRRRGYASAVLNHAGEIAARKRCYKIMLLTGARDEATLRFYERAGYNRKDKTAFIQWLE